MAGPWTRREKLRKSATRPGPWTPEHRRHAQHTLHASSLWPCGLRSTKQLNWNRQRHGSPQTPSPLCLLLPKVLPSTTLRAINVDAHRSGDQALLTHLRPDCEGLGSLGSMTNSSPASPGPKPGLDQGPGGFADWPTGPGSTHFPGPSL